MNTTNRLHTNPAGVISTGAAPTGNTATYTIATAGYYGLALKYDATTPTTWITSFQSDYYTPAPVTRAFSRLHTDICCSGGFDAAQGFIDPYAGNLHQAYVIQAHGCGPTQFFNGTCNNMDPNKNCNTFNALSGDCLTCPNTNYKLTAGACVIPPTCNPGFTLVGVVCVSDLCKTSNSNGACTSCKAVVNEVKADGSCGLKSCASPLILNTITGNCDTPPNNCDPGFFEVQGNCYRLPPNCLALNSILQCAKCKDGYTQEQGDCVKCKGPNPNFPCTTCPQNFFVNAQGGCTRVSPQCATFNDANGLCTSCKNLVPPVNGVCCPNGQVAQGSGCVVIGGGSAAPGGSTNISFLQSPYFKYCGLADTVAKRCKQCKPGRTFVSGTDFCV